MALSTAGAGVKPCPCHHLVWLPLDSSTRFQEALHPPASCKNTEWISRVQSQTLGSLLPDAVQTHWRKFIHWYTSCCDLIILWYSLVLSCVWCVLMMLCQHWRSIEANEVIPAPAPNRKIKHSSPFLLVLTMMSFFPHPVILLWKPFSVNSDFSSQNGKCKVRIVRYKQKKSHNYFLKKIIPWWKQASIISYIFGNNDFLKHGFNLCVKMHLDIFYGIKSGWYNCYYWYNDNKIIRIIQFLKKNILRKNSRIYLQKISLFIYLL